MSDTDREARIQELRRLIERGEYQIDPTAIAVRMVDEHVADKCAAPSDTRQAASPRRPQPKT